MESSGLTCQCGVDLLHPHLFKKNPNQLYPKKMVNKHANALLVSFNKAPLRNHKHNVNIF